MTSQEFYAVIIVTFAIFGMVLNFPTKTRMVVALPQALKVWVTNENLQVKSKKRVEPDQSGFSLFVPIPQLICSTHEAALIPPKAYVIPAARVWTQGPVVWFSLDNTSKTSSLEPPWWVVLFRRGGLVVEAAQLSSFQSIEFL